MDHDDLRIGTAEREESARLLAEHFSQGRLTPDEYETRVTGAYAATTRAELRPLFTDLPAPHPAFLAPPLRIEHPLPYPPPAANGLPAAVPWQPPPVPYSPKSRMVAGILQIVLPFGSGRLYTGHVGIAVLQFVVFVITAGFGALWPIIDGIVLLANGGFDNHGRRLRD
ncbi:DUF1707 domain-containing protein [Amycolatopsis sp. NPDC059027]|uniref:DUF1707 SHOCT-like domain-containing protein n=1 Tax=unclassified Amycolatopsis TaxID=2618356 RepID=UPI00366AE6C3